MTWLTEDLRKDIKKIFEPRYGRLLENTEIEDIALSLVSSIEVIAKLRWRKYEKSNRIQN